MSRSFSLYLFLSCGLCFAYEGYPVSLFAHVAARSYELLADGSDSYVLEVSGMKNFYEEVVKSEKPVVVKFFSPHSSNPKLSTQLFQELAGEYRKKVKFASLDIASNHEMIRKFTAFFIKLAMSMQTSKQQNPVFQLRIMELVKRMSTLEKYRGAAPFVLFFRDGDLIFPQMLDFMPKNSFVSSLEKQLLAPTPSGARAKAHFWNNTGEKKRKASLWQRVKAKVGKWWSKKR